MKNVYAVFLFWLKPFRSTTQYLEKFQNSKAKIQARRECSNLLVFVVVEMSRCYVNLRLDA